MFKLLWESFLIVKIMLETHGLHFLEFSINKRNYSIVILERTESLKVFQTVPVSCCFEEILQFLKNIYSSCSVTVEFLR